jgi:hypothetical protein
MKINITRRHLEVYITESAHKAFRAHKEYSFFGDVLVIAKDPLPEEVDLVYCLQKIESMIPSHLIYGLDTVFIGEYPEFKERKINAFYRDGAIYVTNHQDDDDDLIDDIVHEIAHLVENHYGSLIYSDQKLTREFLGKRQRLFHLLRAEGYDVQPKDFMETDYNQKFDMFLFEEVGYPTLTQLTMGLFLTPYGVTSLSEYFSESFEYFFVKDKEYVRKLTPSCYTKILELEEAE